MIKTYWDSLDSRQRYIAGFGMTFVIVVLAWVFVASPLWAAKA